MKECDKRKSDIRRKLHVIYISIYRLSYPAHRWSMYLLIMLDTLLLRPSLHFTQLHFTPLHYTCRHFTSSHLNFTQLHYPLIWLHPISISYPSISPHFTALLDDFRHTSISMYARTNRCYNERGSRNNYVRSSIPHYIYIYLYIQYIKVKWSRYRPGVAQRLGKGIHSSTLPWPRH